MPEYKVTGRLNAETGDYERKISEVEKKTKDFVETAEKAIVKAEDVGDAMSDASSGASKMSDAMDDASTDASDLADSVGDATKQLIELDSEAKSAGQETDHLSDALDEAAQQAAELDTQTEKAGQATDELGEALGDAARQASEFDGQTDSAQQSASDLSSALDEAASSAEHLGDETDETARGTGGFTEEAERATQQVSRFKETMLGMAVANVITKALATAWRGVTASIGSAMDRMDTMGNFKRTMNLMVRDTDAVDKAMSDLNSTVKGTAYGLDTAASSAQGFVTSSFEIKKATGYVESWGDAIATFGDGTDATLKSVMYQLNQMGAKGKANLGDLRSAMEAGIPVIRIYAEATQQSTEDVSAAISSGKVSAEEFLDVMDTAFREGTESFPALTGAAKDAGQSWEATFSNMKAATTRGMVSIIDSIEDGAEAANMPGMKENLKKAGQTIEKTMKGIGTVLGFGVEHFDKIKKVSGPALTAVLAWQGAKSATSAIQRLNDASKKTETIFKPLKGLMKDSTSITSAYSRVVSDSANAEVIRSAAKNAGIALDKTNLTLTKTGIALTEAQKAAILTETGAITAKGLVIGVLSGQIGITTAAQLGWNAAMAANPVGTMMVAIVAVVASMKLLTDVLDVNTAKRKESNEAVKEAGEASKNLVANLDATKNTFNDNTTSIEANHRAANDLVTQLEKIESSTDPAADKQAKMRDTVKQLNDVYPELNVNLTDNGKAIEGGLGALKERIGLLRQMKDIEAKQQYLKDLNKNLVELEIQTKANSKVADGMIVSGSNMFDIFGNISRLKSAKSMMEVKESYEETALQIEILNEELAEMEEINRKANDAFLESDNTQQLLQESYGLTTDAIVQYANDQGIAFEDAGEQVKTLSDQFGLSADSIVAAVQSQGITLDEWAVNFEQVKDRSQTAVDELVTTSLNGFKKLEQESTISLDKYIANLKSNIEDTKQWSDNLNTLMELGVNKGVIANLEQLGPEGAKQTQVFINELTELNGGATLELGSLNGKTQAKLTELNGILGDGFGGLHESAETSVKAKDFGKIGDDVVTDIAIGLTEGTEKVVLATDEVLGAGSQQASTGSNQKEMVEAGKQAIENYATGITQGSDHVTTAVQQMTDSAVQSFQLLSPQIGSVLTDITRHSNTFSQSLLRTADVTKSQLTRTTATTGIEILRLIQVAGSGALNYVRTTVANFVSTVANGASAAAYAAASYKNQVIGALSSLPGTMYSLGSSSGSGFYSGLASKAGAIRSLASSIASSVATTIRNALQIHSPSRLLKWLGIYTGQGYVDGLEQMVGRVSSVSDRLATAAIPGGSSSGEWSMSYRAEKADNRPIQPLEITLNLGGKLYRMFASNMWDTNNKELELREVFSVV